MLRRHEHGTLRRVEWHPVERDVPGVDREEPREAAEQGRLARAVRAENCDDLAPLGMELDLECERPDRDVQRDIEAHVSPAPLSPSQRSRSATSTRNDTAISTRLRTSASSASVSSARYVAIGTVLVRPGKLPANVIDAPNSPSARAHASTAPAISAGRIVGSVTRRNTYHREAPSVRAASSTRWSVCRSAASTVNTRNGIATNVCATTTPGVVNGSVSPNQRSRYWPNNPRLPNEKKSATPATTGGSTMDSVHSARTMPRPGNRSRASTQASGTPNATESAAAHSEHCTDSRSAVR